MVTYGAADFHRKFGRAECESVARKAGITLEYFMHYVYGNRRPRPARALELYKASAKRLDPQKLVFGELKAAAPAPRKNGAKSARKASKVGRRR